MLAENWWRSVHGRWPKLASQNRESAPCSFAAIQRYEAKIPALDRKLIQGISQKAHVGHKFGLVMPILCLSYRCQWPTELSHFRPLILSHFSRAKLLIQF